MAEGRKVIRYIKFTKEKDFIRWQKEKGNSIQIAQVQPLVVGMRDATNEYLVDTDVFVTYMEYVE